MSEEIYGGISIGPPPEPQSSWTLSGGEIRFLLPRPMPNWWWRMWQWMILGISWRKEGE